MQVNSDAEIIFEMTGESGEKVYLVFSSTQSLKDHETAFQLGWETLERVQTYGYQEAAIFLNSFAEEKLDETELQNWLER